MAVDLRQHKAVLATVFLAGHKTIEGCLARMREDRIVYEKPDSADRRDYAKKAEGKIVDAINYLVMEYVKCEGIGKRATLAAAIGNALWQAHIGVQTLTESGRK